MMRGVLVAAVLAAAAASGAALLWRGGAGAAETPGFRTAALDRGAITAAGVAARTAAAQMRIDLDHPTIRAPIDGMVVGRNVDPGRVAKGQPAGFGVAAWRGRSFAGTVKERGLAAQTVQNVVTCTVMVEAENRDGLLPPGMTATIRIVTDRRADALRVPNAALRSRPAGAAQASEAQAPFAAALAGIPDALGLDQARCARFEALLAEASREVAAAPSDREERRRAAASARPAAGLITRFGF